MGKTVSCSVREPGSLSGQHYLQLVCVFLYTQLAEFAGGKPFRVYFHGFSSDSYRLDWMKSRGKGKPLSPLCPPSKAHRWQVKSSGRLSQQ